MYIAVIRIDDNKHSDSARPDPEQNLKGGAKFPGGALFQHIK